MAQVLGAEEQTERERISFEKRLDMEKAQVIYDKNREFLHFEHIPNSTVISMKIPPILAEILSAHSGGTKTSIGCEQLSKLTIGQKQYNYSVNYSIGGRYGDTRIKFSEELPEMTERDLFNIVYDSINPHMKLRAYKYLCMALPKPLGPEEYVTPCDIPEFHVDYCQQILMKRENIPRIMNFRECELLIDIPKAIYLIECFATNQSSRERAMTEKDFLVEKKIYTLMIFAELPVLFSVKGKKASLTFADYCGISAQDIMNQVQFVMGIFKHCKQMLCQFVEVLNYNFKQAHVIDAENDIGIAIVKDMDHPTLPLKNRTFMIYGLQSEPSERQFPLYESVIREAWKKICIYTCPICQQLNTSRNPCPLGQHVGARIPFEDGSWEKDVCVGGIYSKKLNYECCGEVIEAFDLGCSPETHHTFPDNDVYFTSSLLFRYI